MTLPPCPENLLLLQADADGELDAASAARLAAHCARCAGCAAARGQLAALRDTARLALEAQAAPAKLAARIRALAAQPVPTPPRNDRATPAVAWMVAPGVAVVLFLMLVLPSRGPSATAAEALLSAHVRALQPGHLIDVASSDRHTVKPWFDGRLDYVPSVPDFAAAGFPLAGGRLDALRGQAIAVLVYKRRQHVIDVAVWPEGRLPKPQDGSAENGFILRSWQQNGMVYAAISDVAPNELAAFVALWRSP